MPKNQKDDVVEAAKEKCKEFVLAVKKSDYKEKEVKRLIEKLGRELEW